MNPDRILRVILSPIVTEKTSIIVQHRQYAFKVMLDATKHEIQQAIEMLYKVKVEQVRVLIQKPVQKKKGWTKRCKKAYVKLREGQAIQLLDSEKSK
jgi:large subunit ribosomal protein L23